MPFTNVGATSMIMMWLEDTVVPLVDHWTRTSPRAAGEDDDGWLWYSLISATRCTKTPLSYSLLHSGTLLFIYSWRKGPVTMALSIISGAWIDDHEYMLSLPPKPLSN